MMISFVSAPFADLRAYVGFTQEDAASLALLHPHVQPHLASIAGDFYSAIRMQQGTGFGLMDEGPEPCQRASLEVWLGELVCGPYDDEYERKHAQLGRGCAQAGMAIRFLVAAMGRVRTALHGIAQAAFAQDPETKCAVERSIAHVCDLDLFILIQGHEDAVPRLQPAQLAAGLAHEIRNPLHSSSLHLSVLERTLARLPVFPAAAREAIDVLRAEIRRLGALVTDFLEVARPAPLARVACDANDIVRGVASSLRKEAEARRTSLTVQPSPVPATASLDLERTRAALAHLARNAIEAVPPGGHVVLRVQKLPSHLEIEVADDGGGIADPKAPIFDAFYTTKERGTGLGLAIVHRTVVDQGGDIRFESRPGSTTFTIRLPTDGSPSARSLL